MAADRTALNAALDDLWAGFDSLFESLSDEDWGRKHGKDWVMSDVPYHLASFDREFVLAPVQRGLEIPESERLSLLTLRAVDGWNASEFAKRPPGQTPAAGVEEAREVRGRLQEQMAGMTDADLERPVWLPLASLGERTAGTALLQCVMHSWSELMQLRIRLKRNEPLPAAATTHLALDGFFRLMPVGLNVDAARGREFKARFVIEGDGGSSWLLSVDNGRCETREDAAARADLTMRMQLDAFTKLWNEMQHPMLMMLTRQIRVRGIRKMGTFGKLFPSGDRDAEAHPELTTL